MYNFELGVGFCLFLDSKSLYITSHILNNSCEFYGCKNFKAFWNGYLHY